MLKYIILSCAFILFSCKKETQDNADIAVVRSISKIYQNTSETFDTIKIDGKFNANNELISVSFFDDTLQKLEIVQNSGKTLVNFEEFSQGFLFKIVGQSELNGTQLLKTKCTLNGLFEEPFENEKNFYYKNNQLDSVRLETNNNTEQAIYNQFKYQNNRLEEFSHFIYDESTIPYVKNVYKIEYFNETENLALVNTSSLNFNALLSFSLFLNNNFYGSTFNFFLKEIPSIKSNQLIKSIRVYDMITESYTDVYEFTYVKNEKGQVVKMTENFNNGSSVNHTLFEYL